VGKKLEEKLVDGLFENGGTGVNAVLTTFSAADKPGLPSSLVNGVKEID